MGLIEAVDEERTWQEIITWWETRRFLYNIIMLLIGLISFFVSFVSIPIVYIFIGIGLNLLYTFGWIFELILIRKTKVAIQIHYPYYAFYSYIIISAFLILGFAFGLFF